jgi:predicted transcriptional regulator
MELKKDRLMTYYNILLLMKNDGIYIENKPLIYKKLGLSCNRLILYIEELLKLGFLVSIRDKIVITEKGEEFLVTYSKLLDLIDNTYN